MTENKRYYIGNGENCTLCDSNEGGSDFYNMLTQFEAVDRLNEQEERIIDLKNTIIKITKAYQRKHDNTIVNLVDEIWEEDIEDLIIELNQDGGIRND